VEIDILSLLAEDGLLRIFLVIGIGYLIGNLSIAGIQVGSTIGVLLAGLVFGHYGFTASPGVASFGFALFIFSVGIQAGPTFFSAFREDGLRYIALAVVVAVTGFTLTQLVARLLGLETGFSAGMLAGALTSTPTLAGAQDAVRSGLASLPPGVDVDAVLQQISVGYAMAYVVGTVSLILLIHYFPRVLGIDLPAAARNLAKERGILGRRRTLSSAADTLPIIRAYRVSREGSGKSLEQRRAEIGRRGRALRVRRGAQILEAEPDLVLEAGDVVAIIASLSDHLWAQEQIGAEVLDPELLNYQVVSRDIVVIDRHAAGKPVRELDIPNRYGCLVTGITRAGIQLPASDSFVLSKGDQLHVTGEEQQLQKLAEFLGHMEEKVEETDLLTFAFGIVGGLLLGMVLFRFGDIAVGLGTAGGLLIVGIVIGFLSSIYPTFGRVPAASRFMLMELGLMLFMASVGLGAGAGLIDALTSVGPVLLAGGLLVTVTPVIVGYLFGRRVLKLNPALLLGAITGAMTSTPSLNIVTRAARSDVPALGYAGTYTFANVLLTFAGTLVMVV
jgi:putative transport protein